MKEEKQVTTRIPKDLHRKVRIKSAKTGKPLAEVLRDALRRWADDDDDEKE